MIVNCDHGKPFASQTVRLPLVGEGLVIIARRVIGQVEQYSQYGKVGVFVLYL